MHMSWVLIVITVIVTDSFFFTTDHRGVVCPHLVGDSPCVRTTCIPSCHRAYTSMLFINTGKNALHQTVSNVVLLKLYCYVHVQVLLTVSTCTVCSHV